MLVYYLISGWFSCFGLSSHGWSHFSHVHSKNWMEIDFYFETPQVSTQNKPMGFLGKSALEINRPFFFSRSLPGKIMETNPLFVVVISWCARSDSEVFLGVFPSRSEWRILKSHVWWQHMISEGIEKGILIHLPLIFCYETCTVPIFEWCLACFTRHSRWDLWPQHVKTCCFCIAHIHQPVI